MSLSKGRILTHWAFHFKPERTTLEKCFISCYGPCCVIEHEKKLQNLESTYLDWQREGQHRSHGDPPKEAGLGIFLVENILCSIYLGDEERTGRNKGD